MAEFPTIEEMAIKIKDKTFEMIEKETGVSFERLMKLVIADREERCVVLPCKVGDAVYVIGTCDDVAIKIDDDYFNGTGFSECPFEDSCKFEDCEDNRVRIFETIVTDFWIGEENNNNGEIFVEHMHHGYMISDFGKTVFLIREQAEAKLKERENNG